MRSLRSKWPESPRILRPSGWQRIVANQSLVAELQLAVAETKSLREFMLADYYPLTQTNVRSCQQRSDLPRIDAALWCGGSQVDLSQWAAYQFHRQQQVKAGGEEEDDDEAEQAAEGGFAMYFRRPLSEEPSMAAGLLALDPTATYSVSMFHSYVATGAAVSMNGAKLGRMQIPLEKNGCVLLRYARSS